MISCAWDFAVLLGVTGLALWLPVGVGRMPVHRVVFWCAMVGIGIGLIPGTLATIGVFPRDPFPINVVWSIVGLGEGLAMALAYRIAQRRYTRYVASRR